MFEQPKKIETVQRKPENKTGMPDSLKSGIEALSGVNMDSVRVHYNSSEPARLGALAYTMGNDIHISSGMERHLPHEAWHVVQQMRGLVRPTVKIDGTAVNDEPRLEKEADIMGNRAAQMKTAQCFGLGESMGGKVAQCYKLPAGRNFSSVNRDDIQPANGDGFDNPTRFRGVVGAQLQRDHIIPLSKIKAFADAVFTPPANIPRVVSRSFKTSDDKANDWLTSAMGNYLDRAVTHPGSIFYRDTNGVAFNNVAHKGEMAAYIKDPDVPLAPFLLPDDKWMVLVKSITWMPSNIFMAPHPKANDMGDEFDITAATVHGLPYKLMLNTYKHMKTFLQLANKVSKQALDEKTEALNGLTHIANSRSSAWPYAPNEWTYDEAHNCYRAKTLGTAP